MDERRPRNALMTFRVRQRTGSRYRPKVLPALALSADTATPPAVPAASGATRWRRRYLSTMNASRFVRVPFLSLTIRIRWWPLATQLKRVTIWPLRIVPLRSLKRPISAPST